MASSHKLCSLVCLLHILLTSKFGACQPKLPKKSPEILLVSGYSDRMKAFFVWNSAEALKIEEGPEWPVDKGITWMQLTETTAYAIHEADNFEGVPGGAVSRWKMGRYGWTRQEWVSTQSKGTAHLLVVPRYGLAYASNYGGGSLTIIGMQGEKLGKVLKVERFGNCTRDVSHQHQVVSTPQNDVWWSDWIFLVDLGCDVIRTYVPGGDLVTTTEVRAGAGPRHLALHQHRELAFLSCELKSLVMMYRVNQANGSLELLQEIEFASGDDHKGAEILSIGDYVYASSRGRGVIVVYKLNSEDRLERIQEFDVAGTLPRHMAFLGEGKSGLLAVVDRNKNESSVQVLKIDPETMMILPGGPVAATPPEPAFVSWYPPRF